MTLHVGEVVYYVAKDLVFQCTLIRTLDRLPPGYWEADYPQNNTVRTFTAHEMFLFKRVVFSFAGPVGLNP